MTSLLRSIFTGHHADNGHHGIPQSPSFSDFSLGAQDDAEREFETPALSPDSPLSTQSSMDKENTHDTNLLSTSPPYHNKSQDVWRGTFNPGRNFNMHKSGKLTKDWIDHVVDPKRAPTTWQYILKSEHMKALQEMQTTKGFIDANDLRSKLGPQADVDELIRQADKNGDGKIDYNEFSTILKNT